MYNYLDMILYFSIYSFLGWSLETIYASKRAKKFINRGFLTGFFCPIYGFGAVIIILSSQWVSNVCDNQFVSLIVSIVLSVILVTVLEYITGYILDKTFNYKWWDYSKETANLHGYICVKYSVLWGLLALLLVNTVHTVVSEIILPIQIITKSYIVNFLMFYFLIDTIKSVIDALDLREVIQNYSNFSLIKYHEKIIEHKRFFLAFPHLRILNEDIKHGNVMSILNDRMVRIKIKLKSRFL